MKRGREERREEKRKEERMERSRVKRESALQENKPQARRTDQREASGREKGGEWPQLKVGLLHAVILQYVSEPPRLVWAGWPMARAEGGDTDRNRPVIYIPVRGISLGFSPGNEADGAAPSVTHHQWLLLAATHWYWLRCPPVCRYRRYIYLCLWRNAQW